MRRPLSCLVSLALLFVLTSSSRLRSDETFRLQIQAGKLDREQVPVRVALPEGTQPMQAAFLTSTDGRKFEGQITAPALLGGESPELCFVLDRLPAGETLELQVAIGERGEIDSKKANPGFRWSRATGKFTELTFGARPVFRYMHEALDISSEERRMETYKVYHHLYDPQGRRFVTKGAGGLFPHHRGLFYGFNRISYGGNKKADIWHCKKGESQSHERIEREEAGPVLGRHVLSIAWRGQDGAVFANEMREMTAWNIDGGQLIEFASRLESVVGPVRLDGDPQHAGFQFRGAQDIPDRTKHLTYYLRPDGKDQPGSFRNWPKQKEHVDLPWNAQSFVIDDQRYTCCYIDHAKNPKEARFSERDYGRFGSYFEFDLDKGKPLELRYRIWLQEGEMTVEQVDALARSFVSPVTVKKLD